MSKLNRALTCTHSKGQTTTRGAHYKRCASFRPKTQAAHDQSRQTRLHETRECATAGPVQHSCATRSQRTVSSSRSCTNCSRHFIMRVSVDEAESEVPILELSGESLREGLGRKCTLNSHSGSSISTGSYHPSQVQDFHFPTSSPPSVPFTLSEARRCSPLIPTQKVALPRWHCCYFHARQASLNY